MGLLKSSAIKLRFRQYWCAFPLHFMELGGFLLAAWILGIIGAYATFFPLGDMEWVILFISISLSLLYGSYGFLRLTKKSYGTWLCIFSIFLLGLALISYTKTSHIIRDYQLHSQELVGKNRTFTGYVLDASSQSSHYGKTLYHIAIGKQRIDAWVARGPSLQGGQSIQVKGNIGHVYWPQERGYMNYQARAISQNLVGKLYEGQIVSIGSQKEHKGLALQAKLRNGVEKIIEDKLPTNLGPVAKILLMGGNYDQIEQDIMSDFSFTGLIHILSVSGSHMALLSGLTYCFFKILGLSKRKASYLVILTLLGYACLVGFSPPVIRSLLMGIILAFGLIEGRLYQARQGLTISAFLILLYDPMQVFDVSFQLSFGASYGIILFVKPLYQLLHFLPILLRGPLSLTISAQFLIIPIQLYYFHFISLAGLLASILIAPLLDLVIVLLALGVIWSLFLSIGPIWTCISYLLQGALYGNHLLAMSPYAYLWIGIEPLFLSCLNYGLCRWAYYCWVESHKPLGLKDYLPLISVFIVIGLSLYQNHHPSGLRIHSILLPGGMGALLDDGDNQLLLLALDKKENVSPYIRYRLNKSLHMYGYEKPTLVRANCLPSYGYWKGPKGRLKLIINQLNSYGLSLTYGDYQYAFLHGQIDQKIIQYLDIKESVFMIDSLGLLDMLEGTYRTKSPSPRRNIIYHPKPYEREQVDPDDSSITIVGLQEVEDIIVKE